MTDARLSGQVAQVIQSGVPADARVSGQVVQAIGQLPATMQLSGQVVQVIVQVKRGYITDFDGRPIMVWAGSNLLYLRALTA